MNIKAKKAVSAIMAAIMLSAVTASSTVFTASAYDLYSTNLTQSTDTPSNIIQFNNEHINMIKGSTYYLSSSLSRSYPNTTFRITTSNPDILKITGYAVTALKEGTCRLTITGSNGIKTSKSVRVTPPEQVKFNTSNVVLGKAEKTNIKNFLTSELTKVEWTSSNSSVVSIDSKGNITAKKTGMSVITGTLPNGNSSCCKFTVKDAPTSISFENNKMTYGVGETDILKTRLSLNSASYKIVYSSSDTSIVSVDKKTGEIHALKQGKAVITVKTFNKKTAKCTIEVKAPPKSISLNIKETTIKKGEKLTLKPILPNGTASNQVSYYSSNNRIIKVNNSGIVTGVEKGTAYIAAQTYNDKIVKCKITVK